MKVKWLSRARPSATPWTAAYQAPPPMGFSRQEYWSGVLLLVRLIIHLGLLSVSVAIDPLYFFTAIKQAVV